MHNRESHAPEKGRTYQGEESAKALVDWLNSTKDYEARARIIAVIDSFFRAFEHSVQIGWSIGTDPPAARDKTQSTQRVKLKEAQGRLDSLLSHYILTPWIPLSDNWTPDSGTPHVVSWRTSEAPRPRRRPTSGMEIEALLAVLDLIGSGLIAKIAQCDSDRCDKIFFQKFSHQRFCSEKCRVSDSRNSAEARAKRAAYARKLYQLHKSGKVK